MRNFTDLYAWPGSSSFFFFSFFFLRRRRAGLGERLCNLPLFNFHNFLWFFDLYAEAFF